MDLKKKQENKQTKQKRSYDLQNTNSVWNKQQIQVLLFNHTYRYMYIVQHYI